MQSVLRVRMYIEWVRVSGFSLRVSCRLTCIEVKVLNLVLFAISLIVLVLSLRYY